MLSSLSLSQLAIKFSSVFSCVCLAPIDAEGRKEKGERVLARAAHVRRVIKGTFDYLHRFFF